MLPLRQKLAWLRQQDLEVAAAFSKRNFRPPVTRSIDVCVFWMKPPLGWAKINVDGSCSTASGTAGCGGALRDPEGSWIGGFMYAIGSCNVDEAEAWGVLQGVRLALRLGVRKLIVETDSMTVYNLLQRNSVAHGNVANLIQRCCLEGRQFEDICFRHVYREQNRLADAIAKKALHVSIEIGLCEMLNRQAIRANVAPKDGNFKFNISECEAQLPTGTIDHSAERVHEKLPEWEESAPAARARYMEVVKALADKYPSENLLLVTHGEGVGSVFSDIMNGVTVYDVEYCGYTILKRCIHLGENQSFTAGELTQQSEFGIKFLAAADE